MWVIIIQHSQNVEVLVALGLEVKQMRYPGSFRIETFSVFRFFTSKSTFFSHESHRRRRRRQRRRRCEES